MGDNKLDGGFNPGQRVGEEGLSDSILIIKEHSQADDEKVILQVVDNSPGLGTDARLWKLQKQRSDRGQKERESNPTYEKSVV